VTRIEATREKLNELGFTYERKAKKDWEYWNSSVGGLPIRLSLAENRIDDSADSRVRIKIRCRNGYNEVYAVELDPEDVVTWVKSFRKLIKRSFQKKTKWINPRGDVLE